MRCSIINTFFRAGEPEPGVFGSLEPEPEPLEKKTRSRSRLEKKEGAGACEKIKSIRKLYFSYSSLGKILSFMVKKTIILLVLYFFAVLP